MLVLRDSNGSVHPLVRNALGGFREFSFFGLGSVSSFAVGMRFLKNGDEFNVDSFSTCM
jgi:hypothetical protein